MSDRVLTPPDTSEEPIGSGPSPRAKRRWLWIGGGAAALLAVAVACILFWAGSSSCENLVRERLVARIEAATGARVEIASFHWHLFNLEAEAGGIVIHGREAAGQTPYASVDRLHVRISLLGFFTPRILLRDLEIVRPAVHVIVYADGTTNLPQPRRTRQAGKPALETLFDLRAEHLAVTQGSLDYEDHAADFDAQDRWMRLDFAANDVSTLLAYVPSSGERPESYRIELGARDLYVSRGEPAHLIAKPAQGYLQATVDLARNGAYLRSLRLSSRSKSAGDHSLVVAGQLLNFARPSWSGTAKGDLDMSILDAATGYSNSPEGIARVDLSGQGLDGQFRIDGTIHVDNGSYVDSGVNARGVGLDARVHADPRQLVISSAVARLPQGGELDGAVVLEHWLPEVPGTAEFAPATPPKKKTRLSAKQQPQPKPLAPPLHPAPAPLFVNGKVTAQLKNLSVDTVMDIVGHSPYTRLGIDARLSGPATATWTNGDVKTLAIGATLNLQPSPRSIEGEAPATGTIDATYTQRDGAVDLRSLQVWLPSSHVAANGRLGAYPASSPSSIAIDFESQDLGEFDLVLADLGLRRNGKSGSDALPAKLGGQAQFRGTWTGSLIDPHLTGNLTGEDFSIELPQTTSGSARALHWDTIDASGSYSATRISLDHAQLTHGDATIILAGTLTAAQPAAKASRPNFDGNAQLHLRMEANKVAANELLGILGENLPVQGQVSTQLVVDGPVRNVDGSGWVELDQAVVFGEPIARIRAQGKLASSVFQLASIDISDPAGRISGSGSYDLHSRRFQINASGAQIDFGKIGRLQQAGTSVGGRLDFTVSGSGTADDPRLQGQGTVNDLIVGGEPVGSVRITAQTEGHVLLYDLTTHLASASFVAHGQTELRGDYATRAKLDFSRFNIAGPLKLTHVPGLTGESQLAGTVTIDGPLKHPDQLHGEARLEDLAVTLAGVHLHSEGPVHAWLANEHIALDPVHVTGEETDLHAQGGIDFKANRQLNFTADGSINLKLAETLDPDLTASGTTRFRVEAHGTLQNPGLRGQIEFENAALALEDLPNSLSQLRGTLEFNQNRLEIRSLTAMTGGGQLSVTGYLAYEHGIFADLAVKGNSVRIRYPQGVSSLANADLRLQGSQNNLLLSGNVLITRFSVSPDLDIAALAARTSKVQSVAPPDAPSNHVRLDVRIQTSPQLNFQNAYAKLAGDADLRLRGTVATPSLLGRISITEGNATIAGTRYELQRGEITFSNPVRIQPAIDLNATARVEDYDITLGLHGTLDKMTVSYRSDPPLPEADVVALLALGRTQNEQQIYGQQQEQAAANPTEALLGGALNATVSSRVQKLFGAGAVKVDPTYLGALGNSTTRITVEEQLGKNLTLTYATDVNTTAQQLLQAEIAINRHVSLLVARDESGVFSMVVKATRRYR